MQPRRNGHPNHPFHPRRLIYLQPPSAPKEDHEASDSRSLALGPRDKEFSQAGLELRCQEARPIISGHCDRLYQGPRASSGKASGSLGAHFKQCCLLWGQGDLGHGRQPAKHPKTHTISVAKEPCALDSID